MRRKVKPEPPLVFFGPCRKLTGKCAPDNGDCVRCGAAAGEVCCDRKVAPHSLSCMSSIGPSHLCTCTPDKAYNEAASNWNYGRGPYPSKTENEALRVDAPVSVKTGVAT